MWPYLMMPPANQNAAPAVKSLKEQIADAQETVELLKKLRGEDTPKKEKKWHEKQLSLWDTAILIALFCFFAALPLSIWMIGELKHLKELIVNF